MKALYDVSALIALLDREHSSHEAVSAWFVRNVEQGWASCPFTQNGFLRIVSQPNYPSPVSLAEAHDQLLAATSTQHHQFFAADVSLLDDTLVNFRSLAGHRQLTDVYLLALAVAHEARLVTLDDHIPIVAVHGANETNLVVI